MNINNNKLVKYIISPILLLLGIITLLFPLSSSFITEQAILNTVHALNNGAPTDSFVIQIQALYLKGVYFSAISYEAKVLFILVSFVLMYFAILLYLSASSRFEFKNVFTSQYWKGYRTKP